MFKDPIEFLKHILDECNYLISVGNNLLSLSTNSVQKYSY